MLDPLVPLSTVEQQILMCKKFPACEYYKNKVGVFAFRNHRLTAEYFSYLEICQNSENSWTDASTESRTNLQLTRFFIGHDLTYY